MFIKRNVIIPEKSKNNQGTAGQFDPNQSKGKKEEMKPQPNDKEAIRKKALKKSQADNDNSDDPENKKYPHR
jgi:hypothetical protein